MVSSEIGSPAEVTPDVGGWMHGTQAKQKRRVDRKVTDDQYAAFGHKARYKIAGEFCQPISE